MVDRLARALGPLTTGSSFIQAWDQALGYLDPSWEKQVRHVLGPRSPAAAAAAVVIFISSPGGALGASLWAGHPVCGYTCMEESGTKRGCGSAPRT